MSQGVARHGPGGPRWAPWHLWRVILGRFFWGEKLVFYQEIWGTHGFLWWNMVLLGGYMRKCKEIWGNTGLNGRKEGLRWWFEWISNDENWLFRMKYDHVWWWWWCVGESPDSGLRNCHFYDDFQWWIEIPSGYLT
jgi:hypothetical protein